MIKIPPSTRKVEVGLIVILAFLVTGCATTHPTPGDPFERMNRKIYTFNTVSDRLLLKPVARGYQKIIPGMARTGVSNFFSNLREPLTAVNDLLQGNVHSAVVDTSRFLINSTVGLFGLIDVATMMEIPKHREDFGQTLGKWGIPPGPYLMLPFLGPSNLRDTVGLVPQFTYGDPLQNLHSPEKVYASGLRLVDTRARLLGTDELLEIQPDAYVFLRETYRQQRVNLIYDGEPPKEEVDDDEALIDQLLEE